MNTLIAVGHGSRDPRSERTVAAVVRQVRRRRPDLDVRVAFLDLTSPSVDEVLNEVASEGIRSAVLVPLLLGNAFHARVDLPALLDAARARHPHLVLVQAEVLGDDPRLIAAVRARIVESGVDIADAGVGVLLTAVGSSHAPANQRTRALAERLLSGTAWTTAVTCFATARDPQPAEALARIEAAGADRIVVAPWFLAPGLLTDRVFDIVDELMPSAVRAGVLGDHPLVADVVSSRYETAALTVSTRITA